MSGSTTHTIAEAPLADLLVSLESNRESAVIRLETPKGDFDISILHGILRGAAFGEETGDDVLLQALKLRSGSYEVHRLERVSVAPSDVPAPRPGGALGDLVARAASERGDSFAPVSPSREPKIANAFGSTLKSNQEDLAKTSMSGTPLALDLANVLVESNYSEEAPVPSQNFSRENLRELQGLDRALKSSRRPALSDPDDDRPSEPSAPGTIRVGRYEILARLKSGGMGTVYLCRTRGSAGFRRLFAMKVLKQKTWEGAGALDAFFGEARLLASLHHPNIVGIVDVGTPEEPYIVLDYVEGGSLHELLRAENERGNASLVVSVILDALAGLEAAHRATDTSGAALNVVHCDITPQNLLVGVDGACRVADFGIAETTASGEGELMRGKPGFVAPERVARRETDHRSDIFSLGVVLYAALTGVEPFAAASVDQTMRNSLVVDPPPPSEVGLCPPPCFDWICMKALAKRPEQRFASAEEMLSQLRKVAVREDMLASASEVADWVKESLKEQLSTQRAAAMKSFGPTSPAAGEVDQGRGATDDVHAPVPPEAFLGGRNALHVTQAPSSYALTEKTEILQEPQEASPSYADDSDLAQQETASNRTWYLAAAAVAVAGVVGIYAFLSTEAPAKVAEEKTAEPKVRIEAATPPVGAPSNQPSEPEEPQVVIPEIGAGSR